MNLIPTQVGGQNSAPHHSRRVAVAASGRGRSLDNLLKQEQRHDYKIAAAIISHPHCGAADIAKAHDLPIFCGDFTHAHLSATAEALTVWLTQQQIAWIALAGFLRHFPAINGWQQRVINIHPALLPKFGGRGMYGHHVHEAVIASGDSQSGASLHYVTERYDEGQLIAQITVDVHPDDTALTLADHVFQAECQLYPYVLSHLVCGHLPLPNGQWDSLTYIRGQTIYEPA